MSARQAVVTVVQHLAFEDLGSFAQPLRELGHAIRVVQAGVDADGVTIASGGGNDTGSISGIQLDGALSSVAGGGGGSR